MWWGGMRRGGWGRWWRGEGRCGGGGNNGYEWQFSCYIQRGVTRPLLLGKCPPFAFQICVVFAQVLVYSRLILHNPIHQPHPSHQSPYPGRCLKKISKKSSQATLIPNFNLSPNPNLIHFFDGSFFVKNKLKAIGVSRSQIWGGGGLI